MRALVPLLFAFATAAPRLATATPEHPGLRGAGDMSAAAIGWRPAAGGDFQGGAFKLTLGQGTALLRGPLGITSVTHGTFRMLDSSSYSLSPLGWMFLAHANAGPVRFTSGFGASFLTMDIDHGNFSFGMLSPKVIGALGYTFGRHTLEVRSDVEYDARFLQPDRVFISLGLALRVEVPVP